MSTYSNEPQQTKWEIWFIISTILFLSMLLWRTNIPLNSSPIIYDGLLLTTLVNLVYCIYTGLQK